MSATGRGVNVHAYPSPIRHESRMFKETASLEKSELFDQILLVGTAAPDVVPEESLSSRRRIVRVRVIAERLGRSRLARLLAIVEWWIRVWVRLWRVPVTVFSAHNLAALPLGVALRMFRGVRVVYATHELETERTGWSRLTVWLGRAVEGRLIFRADAIFVVSDAIAAWYRREYPGVRLHVLRNMPLANGRGNDEIKPVALKETLGLPEDVLLFLYQGVFGAGRGVDVLLRTFSAGSGDRHLVFVGFGDGSEDAERVEAAARTSEFVHRLPAVPQAELPRYTAGADVGIYLIEASSLSYQLTVGNKVYEYMSAGIPVIGSDFPDVRFVLTHYAAGWLVEPEGTDFAETVAGITRADVATKKERLKSVWKELCWEQQEADLIGVYAELAKRRNQERQR